MKFPTEITEHAIQRFNERYFEGRLSYDEASRRLDAVRCAAVHVEDIPDEDQEIWAGREPGSIVDVLLCCADGVIKTVLPPGSQRPATRRR